MTTTVYEPITGIRGRVVALDVIRGVALCGITFVNIGPLTYFGYADLLPSTCLPRWTSAAAAALLIAGSLVTTRGGATLIPGMFLLSSCITR